MLNRIEDYAVIGNCESLALVSRDGSIDWMCLPRFDSGACFAALLGGPEHGRWLVGPATDDAKVTRRYRGDTLILETEFETETGTAVIIDFMMRRDGVSDLIRLVRGLKGTVDMFTAGPDRLLLLAPVRLRGEDMKTVGEFTVSEGEEVGFALNWSLSYRPQPEPADAAIGLRQSEEFCNPMPVPLPDAVLPSGAIPM